MAKKVYDFITNNGELSIKNGDLELGESTRQHTRSLLINEKGTFKQFPTTGMGIREYLLEDKNAVEIRRDIQNELENDGQSINKMEGPINDLTIDTNY